MATVASITGAGTEATVASTIGAGMEATVMAEMHGGAHQVMDTIEDFMGTTTEVLHTIEEDADITIEMQLPTTDQEQQYAEDLI